MVMLLLSQMTMSLLSLRWPASEMASWEMPSMRQPSPARTKVWWSTISEPNSAASLASATAKPTELARPWPSGPVVVSMPVAWPNSGWPAVLEPSWRKFLT
ncbi:hypothetical protein D3C87_1456070 [compost metagenome]